MTFVGEIGVGERNERFVGKMQKQCQRKKLRFFFDKMYKQERVELKDKRKKRVNWERHGVFQ